MSQRKVPSPAEDAGRAKWFWPAAGFLAVLLVMIQSREISRPFYGLHSWGKAHGAWIGRAHLKYGFGYTKGLATWAVGEPPPEPPRRYLDHPQLPSVIRGLEAHVLGTEEWVRRVLDIVRTLVSLLILLTIFRGLAGEKAAVLAGLLYVLMPLTGYFGAGIWVLPVGWLAIWAYLSATGSLGGDAEPKSWHTWVLAAAAFLAVQLGWEGVFYCMAIGLHYVARCLFRRQWPRRRLLLVIVVAPALSLALDFLVMAAGWGWDFGKIVDLFVWRSFGKDTVPFTWTDWFYRFWEFAGTNFTWPMLVLAGVYVLLPSFRRAARGRSDGRAGQRAWPYLPGMGLLLLPGACQLLILKNALRPHQYWERPLAPVLALAAALTLLRLHGFLKTRSRPWAHAVFGGALAVVTVYCAIGVNHYFYIRWQNPAKIEMLQRIREATPPDKGLLSFESFQVNENKAKGAHYRPEIAYYLDREIVQAQALEDILQKAATGGFRFYLMPATYPDSRVAAYLEKLAKALSQRYRVTQIPGASGESDIVRDEMGQVKERKFLRAGMLPYLLFDLQAPAENR